MHRIDIDSSPHGLRKFRVLDKTPVFESTKAISEGIVTIKVWLRRRRIYLANVTITTDFTKTYVGDGATVREAILAGFERMKEWKMQRVVFPSKFRVLVQEAQVHDEDNADLE